MEREPVPPVCPGCGGRVPLDTVWVYRERFFCSQECVVKYRSLIR